MQKFRYIFNLSVVLVSLAHIFTIYEDSIDPPVPDVKHYDEDLKNLDFPLIFKFCFLNHKIVSVLTDLGYDGILNFYRGQSMYNASLYGWNGHTPEGGTKGSTKSEINVIVFKATCNLSILCLVLLEYLRDWFKPNISMELFTTNGKSFTTTLDIMNLIPTYPMCWTVDIQEYFQGNMSNITPRYISFQIASFKLTSLSFYIEESSKSLQRALQSLQLSYSGPSIRIDDLANPFIMRYYAKLSQTVFSEQNLEQPCRNYPTRKFLTYADCDRNFVLRELKSLNLTPFWAAKTFKDVTKFRILEEKDEAYRLFEYFTGIKESSCLKPCIVTQVQKIIIKHFTLHLLKVKGVMTEHERSKNNMVTIFFDQTVDVTEYFYPQFSVTEFLSNVGGCLGLWLGLGVIQMGEILTNGVQKLQNVFSKITNK